MMRTFLLVCVLVLGSTVAACSTPIERPTAVITSSTAAPVTDAGPADAGPADAAASDGGAIDGGAADAGAADAAAPDAGAPAVDAGGGDVLDCTSPVSAPIATRIGVAPVLSASCSSDPQGLRLFYRWRVTDAPTGSHALLVDATRVTPTLVPDVPGTYTLELVVSNGLLSSDPVQVTLEVTDCGAALPALSASSAPAAPRIGETVQLDATVGLPAVGCDLGELRLSYAWSFLSRPPASLATLSDPGARDPSFVPDVAGQYVARVVASSSSGLSTAPVDVTIEVADCGGARPAATATATPAAPGIDDVVQLTAVVTDADTAPGCAAHAASFELAWSFVELPAGSAARLNDASIRNPSFVADVAGRYVVRVVATDPTGRRSDAFEVSVDAAACGGALPVVVASATPAAPRIGQPAQLDAVTTDADTAAACAAHAAAFSHRWTLVELPAGSAARLNDATARNPSFTPDIAGRYVARVVATDPTGRASAPSDVTITAATCGGNAPAISAITTEPAAASAVGQRVRLSPTFSDADVACGGHAAAFTFAWRFEELPRGSLAALNDPSGIRPSFTPDLSGTYRVALTLTDPTGRTATAVSAIVIGACGTNAPRATVAASAMSVRAGSGVSLRGTVTDADTVAPCALADSHTLRWRLAEVPAGSAATLSDPAADAPAFIADVPGAYVVSLIATDAAGHASTPATTTITANTCGTNAPVALAQKTTPGAIAACGGGVPITLTGSVPGTIVQLDAALSSDADNTAACGLSQTLLYDWTLLVAPAGSTAALSTRDARTPWLALDRSGEYRVRLQVEDSTGLVSRETVCAVVLP
jgi:PKD repeat protein